MEAWLKLKCQGCDREYNLLPGLVHMSWFESLRESHTTCGQGGEFEMVIGLKTPLAKDVTIFNGVLKGVKGEEKQK